jgi:hypothetical protein
MRKTIASRWSLVTSGACVAALLWPASGSAQTIRGQARAVQATVASPVGTTTTALADTGTLGGATDARQASQLTGSIPSLLTGGALHATTIGWPDEADSEASIAGLALTAAGNTISANFVMARVRSVLGSTSVGGVDISGLAIDGVPVVVTGVPNQQVAIPGGLLVINEQNNSSLSGTVVNALHVIINGTADLVIASAAAKAQ